MYPDFTSRLFETCKDISVYCLLQRSLRKRSRKSSHVSWVGMWRLNSTWTIITSNSS